MKSQEIERLRKLNLTKNWGWRCIDYKEVQIAESLDEQNQNFFLAGNPEDGYFVADKEMKAILQGFYDVDEAEYFLLLCRIDDAKSNDESLTEILKKEFDQRKIDLTLIKTQGDKNEESNYLL